jgi:streptogramin lyase
MTVAFVSALAALLPLLGASAHAQTNPYREIAGWAKAPEGRPWGAMVSVDVDRDGNIWVLERCGANSCIGSKLAPVLKFDPSGKLLTSFGAGVLAFPHGIHVDRDGNVWATDAAGQGGKGHVVVKFSPQGKVLLTLGKEGVAGNGPDTLNEPAAVVTAPNGDIFVADGHGIKSNLRIAKFSKDGKFIKAWGKKGTGPGEFMGLHAIAIDSKGRIFVGDRPNNRIQIFDQDGKFLDEWRQFGRPSGIFIDRNDMMYVADPQSNVKLNKGFKRGIYIGSARDGKVTAFIPSDQPKTDDEDTFGMEGAAADAKGNVYGAETLAGKRARKFVKS